MNLRNFHAVAIAAAVAVFASMAFVSQARADDLNLGSSYGAPISFTGTNGLPSETASGGSIFTSTLNGVTLPWVFCVDITHNVYVPGDYNATTTNNQGIVNQGGTGPFDGQVGGSTKVSDEIAYLLLHYANGVAGQQNTAEGELQAAIWKLEYGSNITINSVNSDNSSTVLNAVANYVTLAQNAYTGGTAVGDRSQLTWLTPGITGSSTEYQELVTITTPEPSSFAIAGLAGLGMLFYARKRRSR